MVKYYLLGTTLLLFSHLIAFETEASTTELKRSPSKPVKKTELRKNPNSTTLPRLKSSRQIPNGKLKTDPGSGGADNMTIDDYQKEAETRVSKQVDLLVTTRKDEPPTIKPSSNLKKAPRSEDNILIRETSITGEKDKLIPISSNNSPSNLIIDLTVISSSDSSSSSGSSPSSLSLQSFKPRDREEDQSPANLPPIKLAIPILLEKTYTSKGLTHIAEDILHILEDYDLERLVELPDITGELGTSAIRVVSVGSLVKLLKGARLNDDIMNSYMNQLTLLDIVTPSSEGEDTKARSHRVFKPISSLLINSTFKKGRKHQELTDEVTFLWPLFHKYPKSTSNHWTLMEIQAIPIPKNRSNPPNAPAFKLILRHYDSLSYSHLLLTGLPAALKYLSERFQTNVTLKDVESQPTPQQSNGLDCGVFVLSVAKRLVLGMPVNKEIHLDIQLLRTHIAIELLGRTMMVPKLYRTPKD